MCQRTLLLLCVILSGLVANQSHAQEPSIPERPLIVGTKVAEPFVIKRDDGTFTGISIELWQRIAEEMGLQYEFREVELPGLISGLQDGTLDVSVAALTVTAEREQQIDFTHPFHTTGLAIAVNREGGIANFSATFFLLEFSSRYCCTMRPAAAYGVSSLACGAQAQPTHVRRHSGTGDRFQLLVGSCHHDDSGLRG